VSKVMFVTVGTSLFHSASWDAPLPQNIQYYDRWLKPEALASPDARVMDRRADEIRRQLREKLTEVNGPDWAKHLPSALFTDTPKSTPIQRYSAELTTILMMAEQRAAGQTVGDFLKEYSQIQVVIEASSRVQSLPASLARIAGCHLTAYLNAISGSNLARACDISNLSSTASSPVLEALKMLRDRIPTALKEVQADELDLVISGGYKIYGIALSHLADRDDVSARILYTHETSEELIIYRHGTFTVGDISQPAPFFWKPRSIRE
jgi:hypothetical protein